VALAKVKGGTYIEVKTQTYSVTNAAATKIKSLNIPCIRNVTGKVTYLDSPAPCTTRSYSAKYYGVNPQG
jgi:hypothetical protein